MSDQHNGESREHVILSENEDSNQKNIDETQDVQSQSSETR